MCAEEGGIMSPPPSTNKADEGLTQSLEKQSLENQTDESLIFEQKVQQTGPQDKIRMDFLRKLSHEKVWVPKEQRPPKHQSLIIFDWDDTLMYTSFLMGRQRARRISPETNSHLLRIEKAACILLEKALELGNTFIITNAEKGWVELCVAQHMPSLKKVLKDVRVISARSTYEDECTGSSEWKNRAFLELGKHIDPQTITNLVSVGDSTFEMDAAYALGQQFSHSVIKTVKLQECPTPEELMKELDIITPKFQTIVERANSMKIRLERKAM
jgi:hypothetical protein